MAVRGRKSMAAITAPAGAVSLVERPEPPLDLTPDEADVWAAVADAMPADWFGPATLPLLAQYCRHTVTARRLGQLLDAEMAREEIDMQALKELTGMQARETGALKAMAASMRISQQSSYSARGAAGEKGRAAKVKRPWE